MSELGQLLKKARIEKGLTLDDVQEATKIRKRYLEAIETGDYKVLPGSFYVRAFVKTYAETVGLNPDEVLQYYRSDIPTAEPEKTIEPLIRRKQRSVQHSDRFGKWATTFLMWSFVILIIVILYFFIVGSESNENNEGKTAEDVKITDQINTNKPSNESETDNEDSSAVTPPLTSVSPEPEPVIDQDPIVVQQSQNRILYSMAEGETIPLELELEQGIWMSIKINDERLANGNYDGGYKQTIELTKDGLYMLLGNADRAKLTINGQSIDLGTGMNKEVTVEWIDYEEAKKLQEEQGTSTSTNNG